MRTKEASISYFSRLAAEWEQIFVVGIFLFTSLLREWYNVRRNSVSVQVESKTNPFGFVLGFARLDYAALAAFMV